MWICYYFRCKVWAVLLLQIVIDVTQKIVFQWDFGLNSYSRIRSSFDIIMCWCIIRKKQKKTISIYLKYPLYDYPRSTAIISISKWCLSFTNTQQNKNSKMGYGNQSAKYKNDFSSFSSFPYSKKFQNSMHYSVDIESLHWKWRLNLILFNLSRMQKSCSHILKGLLD